MNNNPVNWVERLKSGKFISPFDYTHPDKVLERATTKCSGYKPGGSSSSTSK